MKTIDVARITVEKVVLEKGFKDPKALRTAMFHAYPFEIRQGYPYRKRPTAPPVQATDLLLSA